MFDQYKRVAAGVAVKFVGRFRVYGFDRDDVVQEAFLALYRMSKYTSEGWNTFRVCRAVAHVLASKLRGLSKKSERLVCRFVQPPDEGDSLGWHVEDTRGSGVIEVEVRDLTESCPWACDGARGREWLERQLVGQGV